MGKRLIVLVLVGLLGLGLTLAGCEEEDTEPAPPESTEMGEEAPEGTETMPEPEEMEAPEGMGD